MKFGSVPVDKALGAIAAHSLHTPERVIHKGTVLTAADLAAARAAGLTHLVVARLEDGDIGENEAASRLARVIAGQYLRRDGASTGRVNLFAEQAGVVMVDRAAIDALNAADEGITVATLDPFRAVEAGRMVGTVKIIPYGLPDNVVSSAETLVAAGALAVAPFKLTRVGLIQTITPGVAKKVLDKTRRVTDGRLAAMGAAVGREWRVAHRNEALTEALAEAGQECELVLVFGASAISDRRDVVPAAVVQAGGEVIHLGMPVDPGNLLLLGRIGGKPLLGAPGCARSPKENGFDDILARLMAGLEVSGRDITRMGVGGLLMEISSRPQPRELKPSPDAPSRLAAIVLAAGRSTRFGALNKLLADYAGRPVIRHAAQALLDAGLPVIIVTGHQADEVRAALSGLEVRFVHNPDYASGMSGSLRAGIDALEEDVDGALIALGDMPAISPRLVQVLIENFAPAEGRLIVAPRFEGRRGHPILWARRFFSELRAIEGDTGARHLLGVHGEHVHDIAWSDDSVLQDVDTPQALAELAERR